MKTVKLHNKEFEIFIPETPFFQTSKNKSLKFSNTFIVLDLSILIFHHQD